LAYVERKRNPLIRSPLGARALSAVHLPFFLIHPPRGYAVLTTTGRKTGKARRRCVRAIPIEGNRVVIVAIRGAPRHGWAKNLQADPEVGLRLPGGRLRGRARELAASERELARSAYCDAVHRFEYLEHLVWRPGRPRAESIRDLHRSWFEQGTPFVVDLDVRERTAGSSVTSA
jgi:deazaflavin-dependent oxidoreductase (nitroreductase family)